MLSAEIDKLFNRHATKHTSIPVIEMEKKRRKNKVLRTLE